MNSSSANTSLTIQSIPLITQCRICLQSVAINNAYCNCSGYTKGVHPKCLLKWAEHNKIFTDEKNNKYFYCQLCKDKIVLIVAKNHYCGSKEQIKDYAKKHPFQITMTVIFIIGFLGLFVSSIYKSVQTEENTKTIFRISAIACGLILLGMVIGFIWKVVIKQKQTFIGVKSKFQSYQGEKTSALKTQQGFFD